MIEKDNRRDFTRVEVGVEVRAEPLGAEGAAFEAKARDLSLKGILVDFDQDLEAGQSYALTLYLGGRESGVTVEVEGKTVRSGTKGAAFEFTRMVGAESFTHLRNLVRFNAGLERLGDVEKEFDECVGLRQAG